MRLAPNFRTQMFWTKLSALNYILYSIKCLKLYKLSHVNVTLSPQALHSISENGQQFLVSRVDWNRALLEESKEISSSLQNGDFSFFLTNERKS